MEKETSGSASSSCLRFLLDKRCSEKVDGKNQSDQVELNSNTQSIQEIQQKIYRVIPYAYDTAGQKTAPGILLPNPAMDVAFDYESQTVENFKVVHLCYESDAHDKPKLEPLVVSALTFAANVSHENVSDGKDTCQDVSGKQLPFSGALTSCMKCVSPELGSASSGPDQHLEPLSQLKNTGTTCNTAQTVETIYHNVQYEEGQFNPFKVDSVISMEVAKRPRNVELEEVVEICKLDQDEVKVVCKSKQCEDLSVSKSKFYSSNDEGKDGEHFQYACYLCVFMSVTQEEVMVHFKDKHVKEKPYICTYCHLAYSSSYEAQKHIKECHYGPILIEMPQSDVYSNTLQLEINDVEESTEMTAEFCSHIQLKEMQSITRTNLNEYCPINCGKVYKIETLVTQTAHCSRCNYLCEKEEDMICHGKKHHHNQVCKWSFSSSDGLKKFAHSKRKSSPGQHQKKKIKNEENDMTEKSSDATYLKEKKLRNSNMVALSSTDLWDNVCTVRPIRSSVYCCKLCLTSKPLCFQSRQAVWSHIISFHNYPEKLHCPLCLKELRLTKQDRFNTWVWCMECKMKVIFGPDKLLQKSNAQGDMYHFVFVCKECNYRTRQKCSVTRHLKYSHSSCRPYACPYCEYVAVERPKVVHHVLAHHPELETNVLYRKDELMKFRSMIPELFSKLIFYCHVGSQIPGNQLPSITDSAMIQGGTGDEFQLLQAVSVTPIPPKRRKKASKRNIVSVEHRSQASFNNRKPLYRCESCKEVCSTQSALLKHIDAQHTTIRSRRFECRICSYICKEKFTIKGHVRKTHFQEKPYSCSICGLAKSEKLQVRMHMRRRHRDKRAAKILTDLLMVDQLMKGVEKYYKQIIYTTGSAPAVLDLPEFAITRKVTKLSGDVLPNDKPMETRKVPSMHVLNVYRREKRAEIVLNDKLLQLNLSDYTKKEALENINGRSSPMPFDGIKVEPGVRKQVELLTEQTHLMNRDFVKNEMGDNFTFNHSNEELSIEQVPGVSITRQLSSNEELKEGLHSSVNTKEKKCGDCQWFDSSMCLGGPDLKNSGSNNLVASTINVVTGEEIPWTIEYYGSSDEEEVITNISYRGTEQAPTDVRDSIAQANSITYKRCDNDEPIMTCLKSNSINSFVGTDRNNKPDTIPGNCSPNVTNNPEDRFKWCHIQGNSFPNLLETRKSLNCHKEGSFKNDISNEELELADYNKKDSFRKYSDDVFFEQVDYDPKLHLLFPAIQLEDVVRIIMG